MAHTSILRRLALLAATAAGGAVLLTSCGGGGGSGSSGSVVPANPAPPVVPAGSTDTAFNDTQTYSGAASASLPSAVEGAAVVHAHMQLAGAQLDYTATTGHLSIADAQTGKPAASFFYIAYTLPGQDAGKRPVTFFYNGGPGSASMWLHLGSFAPKRIVANYPTAQIPTPTQFVDNQETILPQTDMVFVDAVGTGLSEAIAPNTNLSFWGVDRDAAAFRDFVQRYLAANNRLASPLYLYGESYGAPRTAVLANLLESAGVPITGIVLQSAIMNYNSNCGVFNPGTVSCEGYVPTYAAVGAYYQLSNPVPTDLMAYLAQVRSFSAISYRPAVASYLATRAAPPAGVVTQLVDDTGLPALTWQQNFDLGPALFQTSLLPGQITGRYDARISARLGTPGAADNDPSLTAINAAFVATMNSYLGGQLLYTTNSAYIGSNNATINQWDFGHDGKQLPDTIPDLAAALLQNPSMHVLTLSGYDDLATPFYQSEIDLARLGGNPKVVLKTYNSGHMIYLDDSARRAQRADLLNFYQAATAQ